MSTCGRSRGVADGLEVLGRSLELRRFEASEGAAGEVSREDAGPIVGDCAWRSEGEGRGALNGSAVEKKGAVGERTMRGTEGETDRAAVANEVRRSPFAAAVEVDGSGPREVGDRALEPLASAGELRAVAK